MRRLQHTRRPINRINKPEKHAKPRHNLRGLSKRQPFVIKRATLNPFTFDMQTVQQVRGPATSTHLNHDRAPIPKRSKMVHASSKLFLENTISTAAATWSGVFAVSSVLTNCVSDMKNLPPMFPSPLKVGVTPD
jgi:hypothetical protein